MKMRQIDIKGEVYDIEAYENPIPTGSIFPFAGITAPEGFLLCDGQEVSRFTYPKLYSVIGSLDMCKSEVENMFKLPNLKNRFLQGADGNIGTYKEAGLPNVTGSFNSALNAYRDGTINAKGAFRGVKGAPDGSATGSNAVAQTNIDFDASRCSEVYGKSDTVQPSSLTVNYIIKY